MFRYQLTAMALLGSMTLMLGGGDARAQGTLDAKAKVCDDFVNIVIRGGKIDEATKYLTEDFKDHNLRLASTSRADFIEKYRAMRAATTGNQFGGGGNEAATRTVLSNDNLIVFIVPLPARPDPANPSHMLPASSHFDVYKMRGSKISEHWD